MLIYYKTWIKVKFFAIILPITKNDKDFQIAIRMLTRFGAAHPTRAERIVMTWNSANIISEYEASEQEEKE